MVIPAGPKAGSSFGEKIFIQPVRGAGGVQVAFAADDMIACIHIGYCRDARNVSVDFPTLSSRQPLSSRRKGKLRNAVDHLFPAAPLASIKERYREALCRRVRERRPFLGLERGNPKATGYNQRRLTGLLEITPSARYIAISRHGID